MADNDSDIGAFLSGFVIGGLVGAAVALILAPQSGEETRAQIRQWLQQQSAGSRIPRRATGGRGPHPRRRIAAARQDHPRRAEGPAGAGD